jgi:hypothetical protein
MPSGQAGVAAAVASTSRQVGQSLGVAIVGATATAGLAGSLHEGLASASHTGWWIIAGCGALVLAIGLASTTRWADGTAVRTAARLADPSPRAADAPATIAGARPAESLAVPDRIVGAPRPGGRRPPGA